MTYGGQFCPLPRPHFEYIGFGSIRNILFINGQQHFFFVSFETFTIVSRRYIWSNGYCDIVGCCRWTKFFVIQYGIWDLFALFQFFEEIKWDIYTIIIFARYFQFKAHERNIYLVNSECLIMKNFQSIKFGWVGQQNERIISIHISLD